MMKIILLNYRLNLDKQIERIIHSQIVHLRIAIVDHKPSTIPYEKNRIYLKVNGWRLNNSFCVRMRYNKMIVIEWRRVVNDTEV